MRPTPKTPTNISKITCTIPITFPVRRFLAFKNYTFGEFVDNKSCNKNSSKCFVANLLGVVTILDSLCPNHIILRRFEGFGLRLLICWRIVWRM